MDESLLLQVKGRVAVPPDRKTGEALLYFTEPSWRRVEVRLTAASNRWRSVWRLWKSSGRAKPLSPSPRGDYRRDERQHEENVLGGFR